ncbi:hypothetical protein ACJMK2_025231, partial [Sinanodonta woodiana]
FSVLLKHCVSKHCDRDHIDFIVQACAELHGLPMDLDLLTILNDSSIMTKLCTNLDCFLTCFNDPLSLCAFNTTKSLKHDIVAYRTTFRYLCSNSTEAVNIYQTCREDIQTRNSTCKSDLDLALRQAEANLTSSNDTASYKNVVCQAYSYYTLCMELSNSSTCPKQHVQNINTTVYTLYSRAECGKTSVIAHVYNYTGYCNFYTYPNGIIGILNNISNLCRVDRCTPYCVSYRISTECSWWTGNQALTSIETIKSYCSNVDCTIECMNEILDNCSHNAAWLMQFDRTVELASARHMCQNITFTLEALNCSHDYRNHPCFSGSTVSDYINAPIKYNNGDLQGFTTAVCRLYAYMRQCWTYEVSGVCTESQAAFFNELVQIGYSRPVCNYTFFQVQSYNMTTSCSSSPKGNNSVNCTDYCSPACLANRMTSSCLQPFNISYVDIFKFMNVSTYLESYCRNLDCILVCLDSLLVECERLTNGSWLMQFDRIAYRSTSRLICDNVTMTVEASRNCSSSLISETCWSSNSETAALSAYDARDEQRYVSAMCNRYNGLSSCMNFTIYCTGERSKFMNKVVNASYSLALCNVSSPVSALFDLKASCSTGNSNRTSGACNSTSARVTGCLASYQLGSFPYGSNLTNLQQFCSNLDCTLDCLRNATAGVSYYCSVEYDNATLITPYLLLCANMSLTASATNNCASYFQARQTACQPMLNDSLKIISNAFQNSSDEKAYVMETCSAKVNFTNCMKLPINGSLYTCTDEEAKLYNDALNATYSLSVCGLSSPLANVYNMNTYCGFVSNLTTTAHPSPSTDSNYIGSTATPMSATSTSPATSTTTMPSTTESSLLTTTLTAEAKPSTTTATTSSSITTMTTIITPTILTSWTLPSPTTDANYIDSTSTPIPILTIASPETTSMKALPTSTTYSPPSATTAQVTMQFTTTATISLPITTMTTLTTPTLPTSWTLPSPTTDANYIDSTSTPTTVITIAYPESTYSPPSTTMAQMTTSSPTTTTTHSTTPTTLTSSTQALTTFPTTNLILETSTSSQPITTTPLTSTTSGTVATSVQMPSSTITITATTTSSSPILTTKTTMTTTSTTTPKTTTTIENIITCTSVNSGIMDCLTQYNLPSYNLTEYVNNAVTICEKLECIMGCIKNAVGDCYKNNILYLTYDTVALISTYRYMCDNFNETVRAFKECASKITNRTMYCLPSLSTALSQATINLVTDNNKANYLLTMCSGFSAFKTCVAISASGNCTPTLAALINTVQRSWYSYYQCGVTSELYATYYQDPVCTQNDAEGIIYGRSRIHIRLLLGSLCLMLFFK